ncbi:MAG: hypothetical protein KAH84_08975 [Thiomargarita sp.]|nr:hypothetical protein [Thiomargarita sp.]
MDNNKRVTKLDLNQLAQAKYTSEVYCEHIRSGKRGWYLYQGEQATFIGANANEAWKYLESQEELMIKPELATIAQAENVNLEIIENEPKKSVSPPELLDIFLGKFPKTFFKETEKIRPLQKYIHKKIYQHLNKEYTKKEISAALIIYTQNIDYCKVLAKGGQRINFAGEDCEEVSLQHIKDAQERLNNQTLMRFPKQKKEKKVPLPYPELEQLIEAKVEYRVKINELPTDSKTLKTGWEEFIINTEKHRVRIVVRPRTWKKLQEANKNYPLWIANIKGKLGLQIPGGFELLKPGIQIFERAARKI